MYEMIYYNLIARHYEEEYDEILDKTTNQTKAIAEYRRLKEAEREFLKYNITGIEIVLEITIEANTK